MLVEATGHPSDHHPYLLAEPVMSEGQISSASASTEHLPSNYSQELHGIGNVFTHPPPPLPGSQKRRRPSKFGMPSIIKRSASTPNIRGQAAADAAALAEKRRNKLGYHRTSVACGHCRRRKIRCLQATDDPQRRCSNCIRLKKECNFFPVDQQTQPERRGRTGSKATTGGSSSSGSPSPGLSQGQSIEQVEDFNNYSPATSISHHEFVVPNGVRNRTESVSSLGRQSRLNSTNGSRRPDLAQMHTNGVPRTYELPNSAGSSSAWNSPFIDQSPLSGKPGFEDPSASFWRLADSPMTPAFTSSFAVAPAIVATHGQDGPNNYHPLEGSREDVGWPLPSRSMSVGHFENLHQQYPPQYPVRADFKQPIRADSYPHPIMTHTPSTLASMSEPNSAIVESKPVGSAYGAPPLWNTGYNGNRIGEIARKPSQGFANWQGDFGHLAQVEEESVPPHYTEGQAMYFPAATQSHG